MVAVELTFRENFGFLYDHRFKAMFLIFIAFVNLGLSTNSPELEYSTTILVLADGCGLLFMSCSRPDWFPTEDFDLSQVHEQPGRGGLQAPDGSVSEVI
mmetsp:Transcript_35560/g.80214  ORF Transcript_35560/g.80214 Transcript_35560/m.80214 type:complete len:99 (+) Transcript_35560:480-776(+)